MPQTEEQWLQRLWSYSVATAADRNKEINKARQGGAVRERSKGDEAEESRRRERPMRPLAWKGTEGMLAFHLGRPDPPYTHTKKVFERGVIQFDSNLCLCHRIESGQSFRDHNSDPRRM